MTLARILLYLGFLSLSFVGIGAAVAAPSFGGHFELETTNGQPVTDATYHGKWQLIYFGYTACPDLCPSVLTEMGAALEGLGPLANRVQPIFVTLDPERDTAPTVAAYMKSFDPRIVGLVGTPEQLHAAAKAYRVYFKSRDLGKGAYTIDHSSFLFLMGPDGRFEKLISGDAPGHDLADELRASIH